MSLSLWNKSTIQLRLWYHSCSATLALIVSHYRGKEMFRQEFWVVKTIDFWKKVFCHSECERFCLEKPQAVCYRIEFLVTWHKGKKNPYRCSETLRINILTGRSVEERHCSCHLCSLRQILRTQSKLSLICYLCVFCDCLCLKDKDPQLQKR